MQVSREAALAVAEGHPSEISEASVRAQGQGFVGTYEGEHPVSGQRFLVFAITDHVGTVSFYYEAYDMSASDFATRAHFVLERVELVEA
jgi:hypothetical protein